MRFFFTKNGIFWTLVGGFFLLASFWISNQGLRKFRAQAQRQNETHAWQPATQDQSVWMVWNTIDEMEAVAPEIAARIKTRLFGSRSELELPQVFDSQEFEKTKNTPIQVGQIKSLAEPFYSEIQRVAPKWLACQLFKNGTAQFSKTEFEKISASGNKAMPALSFHPWEKEFATEKVFGDVQLGDLKKLFSFDFEEDRDGDGEPDLFEEIAQNCQDVKPNQRGFWTSEQWIEQEACTVEEALAQGVEEKKSLQMLDEAGRKNSLVPGRFYRFSGYLTAPIDGDYYFWISGGASVEFWLSESCENQKEKKMAFTSPGWDYGRHDFLRIRDDWPKWNAEAAQASGPIFLKSGQKYFFKLYIQTPQDYPGSIALAWEIPGEIPAEIPRHAFESCQIFSRKNSDKTLILNSQK